MQGLQYEVDVVFCIDATASMTPVLNEVKNNALKFSDDLFAAMDKKQKSISKLRGRIIMFRDLFHDTGRAMEASEFFVLPEQNGGFAAAVKKITPVGGGDEPESALEALALAINSDWVRTGDRRRHVIVLWTDASAHRLEDGAARQPAGYPAGIPSSLMELTAAWEGQTMDAAAKRLLVYAPDAYPWNEMLDWESYLHFVSRAGEGLAEHDYAAVLETIANSI